MIGRWELKGREARRKDNAETLRRGVSRRRRADFREEKSVAARDERYLCAFLGVERGSHEIFVYTRTSGSARRVPTAACDTGFFAAKLAISGRNDTCQSSRH